MMKKSLIATLAVLIFAAGSLPALAGPAPVEPKILRGPYAGFLTGGPTTPGGFVRLTVSRLQHFTAKISVAGEEIQARGVFAANGTYTGFAAFKNGRITNLAWTFNPATGEISGTITDGATVYAMSLFGNMNSRGSRSPKRGRYTMILQPPAGDPSLVPQAPGYLVVNVTSNGLVRAFGRVGDGTPTSFGSVLRDSGDTPVYRRLYLGPVGLLTGMLKFRALPGSDIDGMLAWTKPKQKRQSRLRTYRNGFDVDVAAVGSSYDLPTSGLVLPVPALAGNGAVSFFNPASRLAFTRNLTISASPEPSVLNPGRDHLSMRFKVRLGVMHGRIRDRGTIRRFTGVVFQKVPGGAGNFVTGRTAEPVDLTVSPVVRN
jgi:hypothetical protein